MSTQIKNMVAAGKLIKMKASYKLSADFVRAASLAPVFFLNMRGALGRARSRSGSDCAPEARMGLLTLTLLMWM